jgi:hypothetical protein
MICILVRKIGMNCDNGNMFYWQYASRVVNGISEYDYKGNYIFNSRKGF